MGSSRWGYRISPEAGTPITYAGLFATFSSCTGKNYSSLGLSRYYSDNGAIDGKMIQVVPTASMNIGNNQTLQYMKITVKTWNVTGYSTSDGSKISCTDAIPTPQAKQSLRAAARFANFAFVAGSSDGTPYSALAAANLPGKESYAAAGGHGDKKTFVKTMLVAGGSEIYAQKVFKSNQVDDAVEWVIDSIK